MRLLHTSDWHLGRSFHHVDLLEHQARALDHLVATVRSERVDLVIVAGDVYDRALPPVHAVALGSTAFERLVDAGARVLATSGNHDSALRLGAGAGLLDRAGLHLRTDPTGVGRPLLLDDAHGPVAVYGLPYLEPAAVRDSLGGESLRGHPGVLAAAMARVRADLAQRPGTRSVVAAHAFVTGGVGSDSERELAVGGLGDVPVSTFDGVDYVALGHLHGAQAVGERVRYSGSPLAYSFSEAAHRKSAWLVDLGATGVSAVERVPFPVPRPLASLRGRLDELLTDPRHDGLNGHFLAVTLTDPARQVDAMRRLATRFPHVATLSYDHEGGVEPDGRSYAARLQGRSDLEVLGAFVTHVRRTPPTESEAALLTAALDAGRLGQVSV